MNASFCNTGLLLQLMLSAVIIFNFDLFADSLYSVRHTIKFLAYNLSSNKQLCTIFTAIQSVGLVCFNLFS